jgi:hypothetical protein
MLEPKALSEYGIVPVGSLSRTTMFVIGQEGTEFVMDTVSEIMIITWPALPSAVGEFVLSASPDSTP